MLRSKGFTPNPTLNPNAKAIANNFDLLTEILAPLPVKSLLRFKSVSEGWYSLISNPEFCRRVFPDFLVSGLVLFRNSNLAKIKPDFIPLTKKSITDAPSFTFINTDNPMGLRILQSCHGLLLCSRACDLPCFVHACCIYNPTTEQVVRLPRPVNQHTRTTYDEQVFRLPQPANLPARFTSAVTLAFDPTKSPHYKVVCVRTPDPGIDYWSGIYRDPTTSIYQIQIYSSQTRSWRPSGNPFAAHVTTQFCVGVFWNGGVHWINECNRDASLYFNVELEKLEKFPMPPIPDGLEDRTYIGYFGESRDHLHLIRLYEPQFTKFDVYEMERDYSGWFSKHHLDLDAMAITFPEMIIPANSIYYSFVMLCVVREANDEDSYMVLHIPGKAIGYKFNDGSFEQICDIDLDDNDDEGLPLQAPFISHVAYQFIQNVCSV